jgi:hypothetical protein
VCVQQSWKKKFILWVAQVLIFKQIEKEAREMEEVSKGKLVSKY